MKDVGIDSEKIIRRRDDGELEYQPDDLTIEEPLEIRIGGTTVATTMRTPGNDEELAVGFLVGEGLVRKAEEISGISRPEKAINGRNIICVDCSGGLKLRLTAPQRLGTITSSCGLCGKDSIEAMRRQFPAIPSRKHMRISIETLLRLPDLMRSSQEDFRRTGGIHAAALFDHEGNLRIVREDIGRHNAVDKVIGRAALDGDLPLNRHILLVSGRASFEIVQKALAAGIPIVASVSAPSALAVNIAREMNQTLIGFLRPPSFNIYSHVERIILERAAR